MGSNFDDESTNRTDLKWLFGEIERGQTDRFFLIVVQNRRSETLKQHIEANILEGKKIITDGYPSYPSAIDLNKYQHEIVNHSVRFTNDNGEHTNNIENIWSHLKCEIRRRNGVFHSNISEFLLEFAVKKMYKPTSNRTLLLNMFVRFFRMSFE